MGRAKGQGKWEGGRDFEGDGMKSNHKEEEQWNDARRIHNHREE